MLEDIKKCPSCSRTSFKPFLTCKDFMVTHESFSLVTCTSCSLVFTSPRPDESSISKYYSSSNYISHSNSSRSLKDILYQLVRNYSLKKKVSLINSLTNRKSLLDYGCGTGHFLNSAYKDGWDVSGVEPSSEAINNCSATIRKYIVTESSELPETSFKIITLWHVLEHIHQLNKTLDHLRSLLEDDGKLVIAVPNVNSYDAEFYKEFWAAYDVPRHLYHFTKDSMKHLLHNHDLIVDQILPMKFDSYYVSLLSEKYKTKYTHYIRSFINGYKSNSYARNNGNYSSLIYIVTKA